MEILLVRHAETKSNLEHRYIGRTDEPLCAEGIKHAESKGIFPEVTRVTVSPLKRARQTAAILFPNALQVVYEGLAEMYFGKFEGKNFEEMANDPLYQAWVDSQGVDRCPGGESRADFISRTAAEFKRALRDAVNLGEERLVIVAHGGTAMAVTSSFSNPPIDYFDCRISHCEAYKYTLSDADFGENPRLINCAKLVSADSIRHHLLGGSSTPTRR